MKGADMAFIHTYAPGREGEVDYDEFNQFKAARFVTPQEAYMAMWGYPIVWKTHRVIFYFK